MKKHVLAPLILTLISFAVLPSFAQIRKIPAEVTEALKQKYPDAENVSWKDKLSVFAASFEMNNEKYEARFTDKGEWKSTEKEITENDLPGDVKDGFEKSKYADWESKYVYSIELPDNEMQYRIQVAKNNLQKKNLLFNNEGKLLKDNITLK
jgi:putative PepSY-like beta-lactamase-inhibitor